MKKNNKGLTLIELVVTIAIIAIFSGIVLSIISSGSSMYRSTSSNAKVQMETQQTLDTLQNLVIDANRSVYYALGSGDNLGAPLGNDIDDQSVVGSKTFLVCKARELPGGNTEQCTYDIVDWDAENQKLYYSQKEYEREKTEPDTGNTSNPDTPSQASTFSDDGEEAAFSSTAPLQKSVRTGEVKTLKDRFVMAENITDFRVDVDKVVKDRIVRFQITENVNGKEIETLHTVNLRNQIQIAEPDVAFDKAPPSKASNRVGRRYYYRFPL
ncbi:MAG: prepilin-type N-terminal cleavage/methylation domain-containing protein [Eubacteriales bacterium]|nr:prepilin-type N-terminal cleavage/methylation domain-containing protein [Eubacteriales bacterium]